MSSNLFKYTMKNMSFNLWLANVVPRSFYFEAEYQEGDFGPLFESLTAITYFTNY